MASSRGVRFLWTVAGTVFLALGVAGVILPLMPGTVFLLLASICFLRGSTRLHAWLMRHPVLGAHVKAMTGEAPMPRRAKITAISAMWIAVVVSLVTTDKLVVQLLIAVLAVYGTWFIAARR